MPLKTLIKLTMHTLLWLIDWLIDWLIHQTSDWLNENPSLLRGSRHRAQIDILQLLTDKVDISIWMEC